MNALARSFRGTLNLLFGLGIVCLAFRLFAGDGSPADTSDLWKELLVAQESFYESKPPSLEKKEFDAFLKEYAEKAGKLADQFKDYQVRFPGSTNVSKAWDNWMNLLDIAAHGSAARRAELEKSEQQCLADPKLSPKPTLSHPL